MRKIATYGLTSCRTVSDLLRMRAQEDTDTRAYTFLAEGEEATASLTYGELDRRVRAIAAVLQRLGAKGERAILLYPPGLEFIAAFLGCLYAGVVAIPAYPPNPTRLGRSINRFRAITRDAQPLIALTTSQTFARSQRALVNAPDLLAMQWLTTDEVDDSFADDWNESDMGEEELAYLQYTSGSTAVPKGVMVTHDNVMHNIAYMNREFQHTKETVSLTWLPTFHDLGLMDAVFQPLSGGFHSYVMPPMAFLQQPARWLKAISRYGVTYSSGPNSAFDLCVTRVKPEQREGLDLSTWQVAIIAAEPVRQLTIDRFTKAFEPYGFNKTVFSPGFGLAEATLKVTGSKLRADLVSCTVDAAALEQNKVVEYSPTHLTAASTDASPQASRTLVGCGHIFADEFDINVVIANPNTLTKAEPDEVGEIWVSSPSNAKGYWNGAVSTAETFHAYLLDTGEGPFLRTGDLGFVKDGQLFITGRLKDVIIIGGRNHYPQDIEESVEECHPALRKGGSAAFSIDVDGEERLVVVAEVGRVYKPYDTNQSEAHKEEPSGNDSNRVASKELIRAMRRAVSEEHDLGLHAMMLLKAGSIPKTSSGKIQRRQCRQNFIDGTFAQLSWDHAAEV